MPGYQKDYEIHYYETDRTKEVTPVAILHFMEDAAISHSEAVGLGMENLLAQGVGWVLNRWVLKMDKYPQLGDILRIETWPSKFERFYATREFNITDLEGNSIGRASSLWVYLNVEKKRPLRIPSRFEEAYGLSGQTVIDNPFGEFGEIQTQYLL